MRAWQAVLLAAAAAAVSAAAEADSSRDIVNVGRRRQAGTCAGAVTYYVSPAGDGSGLAAHSPTNLTFVLNLGQLPPYSQIKLLGGTHIASGTLTLNTGMRVDGGYEEFAEPLPPVPVVTTGASALTTGTAAATTGGGAPVTTGSTTGVATTGVPPVPPPAWVNWRKSGAVVSQVVLTPPALTDVVDSRVVRQQIGVQSLGVADWTIADVVLRLTDAPPAETGDAGVTSYGVYVTETTDFRLMRADIRSGDGSAGTGGGPGLPGSPGSDGSNGAAGQRDGSNAGDGGSGGAGGGVGSLNPGGSQSSCGGSGFNAQSYTSAPTTRAGGSGGGGGCGGCEGDNRGGAGGSGRGNTAGGGQSGTDGCGNRNGNGGSTASGGSTPNTYTVNNPATDSLIDIFFIPGERARTGPDGTGGRGGGGGGGGSGQGGLFCNNGAGCGGGGGGGGGEGGVGGQGGMGGGGSFAFFAADPNFQPLSGASIPITASTGLYQDVIFTPGAAGAGGAGGLGGAGGSGGGGGSGGTESEVGNGGGGGSGGTGGAGGRGEWGATGGVAPFFPADLQINGELPNTPGVTPPSTAGFNPDIVITAEGEACLNAEVVLRAEPGAAVTNVTTGWRWYVMREDPNGTFPGDLMGDDSVQFIHDGGSATSTNQQWESPVTRVMFTGVPGPRTLVFGNAIGNFTYTNFFSVLGSQVDDLVVPPFVAKSAADRLRLRDLWHIAGDETQRGVQRFAQIELRPTGASSPTRYFNLDSAAVPPEQSEYVIPAGVTGADVVLRVRSDTETDGLCSCGWSDYYYQSVTFGEAPPPSAAAEDEEGEPEDGLPWWIWLIVAGGAICCFCCILFLCLAWRRGKKREEDSYDQLGVPGDMSTTYSAVGSAVGSGAHTPRTPLKYAHTPDWEVNPADIKMGHKIGEGCYGIVFFGTFKKNAVAVKQLKDVDIPDEELLEFRREAELMVKLRPHPNVVLCLGVCTMVPPYSLVTEYVEGGSLAEKLVDGINDKREFPLVSMLYILRGAGLGLGHLHDQHIIHRDLAARNILLKDIGHGLFEPKIADFGMSRAVGGDDMENQTKSDTGPLKIMAPECLLRKEYSAKSDVWAFGVLIVECLTRQDAHPDETAVQVASKVARGELVATAPDVAGDAIKDLVARTQTFDSAGRTTLNDIVDTLAAELERHGGSA